MGNRRYLHLFCHQLIGNAGPAGRDAAAVKGKAHNAESRKQEQMKENQCNPMIWTQRKRLNTANRCILIKTVLYSRKMIDNGTNTTIIYTCYRILDRFAALDTFGWASASKTDCVWQDNSGRKPRPAVVFKGSDSKQLRLFSFMLGRAGRQRTCLPCAQPK